MSKPLAEFASGQIVIPVVEQILMTPLRSVQLR